MSGLVLSAGPSCARSGLVQRLSLIQTRHYAAKDFVPHENQRNAFVAKKSENSETMGKKRFKRGTRIGLFRSMPAGQLTQEVFMANDKPKLKLPLFKPTKNLLGQATKFETLDEGPMRWFGTPKNVLLEFRLLSEPCSIVRDITVSTAEMLDVAKTKSSSETRVVLTGRAGSGKSYLLLQAIQHCVSNDWIVIYFPRAIGLVNSTTPHAYDLRTQTYLQPVYAYQTLQRLLSTNLRILSTLNTQRGLMLERREIRVGTPLVDLINIGIKEGNVGGGKEQGLACVVLEAVMTELGQQRKNPVLLAIDDFQALYCRTAYKDPQFASIRPYHLSMPRLLLEYVSGKRNFARGAVLGAVSRTDNTYAVPIELRDALQIPHSQPVSPLEKRSRHLVEYTEGLRALEVPSNFSVGEAASLFDVWMKDRALSAPSTDELFLSKYTESSGNPRDFVWKGLLSSLEGSPPVKDDSTPWPQLRLL